MRIDLQSLVVVCNRTHIVAESGLGIASVVVRSGVLRIDLQSLVVVCNRTHLVAESVLGTASIVVRCGVLRIDLQSLVVKLSCFLGISLLLQGKPQREVILCGIVVVGFIMRVRESKAGEIAEQVLFREAELLL